MAGKKHISIIALAFVLFSFTQLHAYSFFTGNAGGKLEFSANESAAKFDPDLKLEAFFEGQFSFSNSLWSHLDFSLNTDDFISAELFHETAAKFRLDEISLIYRSGVSSVYNYMSVFLGTYDPVGSDIFFQRYFGSKPLAYKITESWLGRASEIIYPHFGIGVSDVLRFYENPLAVGFYGYVNKEDVNNDYVFNADLRFAGVYRYVSFDLAGGIGTPMKKPDSGDALFVIDSFYWHAGLTLLIGNNYTQSFFMQAGLFNASFTKGSPFSATTDDFYVLLEPRFRLRNAHLNISIFSLPQATVDKLTFIHDPLGVNVNVYTDSLAIGSKVFTAGINLAGSLPGKSMFDLLAPATLITGVDDINAYITPYFSTTFLTGELHGQLTVNIMGFFQHDPWYKTFTIDAGYRLKF